jgi:P pilus assembly chaperone PapD
MKKTLLLLFVCLFVGISHAQAQVTVKGTVISSEKEQDKIREQADIYLEAFAEAVGRI